jgi:undecaprenyl diphosphate synthase
VTVTAATAPLLKPRHVAVIMDGNGRWAQQRGEPRSFGHRAGVKATRALVRAAAESEVEVLTVYAFSQENWARPAAEVDLLLRLFSRALDEEVAELHEKGVRLRFIGDREPLGAVLQKAMAQAEVLTANNTRLQLLIAVGYSGQWDLVQAAERCRSTAVPVTAERLAAALSTADLPDVDLLIRTGGEFRISNFLLWQSAYAELYFTPLLWPDFDGAAFASALAWYGQRDRRFGRVAAVS